MSRLVLLGVVLLLSQLASAQQPSQPLATIVVAEPKPDQLVRGSVSVHVKTEVPQGAVAPQAFYVSLGGAAWLQMQQSNREWVAEIDSTQCPNGSQTLTIISDNRKVKTSINVDVKNPLKIYFADLHSHTSYSDGTLTPAMAHDYARNIAKLDVFCLTDHLESVDDAEWLDTREVAFDANEDGEFVVFPGLEWTKQWGHLNIYDPKTRHWPEDPQAFYQAAAEAGVVTKFNHPGDGAKTHGGLAYSKAGDRTVQLMEVRHEDEQAAFIRALNNGWHLAPEGSDDTHDANWGKVRSWTGIYAPGLSKQNILDALSKRRCYSTLDRNCRMMYRINEAQPGDIVAEPVRSLDVYVRVSDPDQMDVISKIELFEDGNVVATDEPNRQGRCWSTSLIPSAGKHYYFIKVTQADGNLLWSAPIWLTVSEQ